MGVCRIETMLACMAIAMSMTFYVAYAPDPPPLQDFCVAANTTELFGLTINGLFCKNPSEVTSNDFVFHGFNTPGNTSNRFGSKAVMTGASRFPALNTMGVAMGRVDFAPGGVNPLHFHPRASEMLTVLTGTLYAGFISSNKPSGVNTLYSAVLNPGDIFVFPQGLVHFQVNVGETPAVSNNAFGSQNPGRVDIANAAFGSTPSILDYVLSRSFQVNETVIEALKAQFSPSDSKMEIVSKFEKKIGFSSLA